MGAGSSTALKGARVVIIGGNIGGAQAAQEFEKKGATVTVIEPKDRLYIGFGGVRAGVVDNFEDEIMVPYDKVLKNPGNKFVRAFATGVDDAAKTVTYQPLDSEGKPSGSPVTVQYDYLVLATGSNYHAPMKAVASRAELKSSLNAVRAAIKQANNIVIVGGGPTGIEMSGEIKRVHPAKNVTIVHSRDAVLSDPLAALPPKFAVRIEKEIGLAGIKLVKNARVDMNAVKSAPGVTTVAEGYYAGSQTLTVAGQQVPADLVITATGATPNTAWLKGSSLASRLDDKGFVKVELTYQVKGSPRVFAIGDCCGSHDAKAGWLIPNQIGIVSANIVKLYKAGGEPGSVNVQLKQAKKPFNGIGVIPVGDKHGAAFLPGLGMVKFILPMKTKAYFADQYGPKMGYSIEEMKKANKA